MKQMGGEAEFMKNLGSLLGTNTADLPTRETPSDAPKPGITAKTPEKKAPEFTLDRDDNEGLLQLVVSVPGLESMKGVDLDVTEDCASLDFPSSVGLRPLKVELPTSVVPTAVKAKFSKKTQQITVKLPLLLQVTKAG